MLRSVKGIIYYLYIVLLNTIVFDYLGMYISSESSVYWYRVIINILYFDMFIFNSVLWASAIDALTAFISVIWDE